MIRLAGEVLAEQHDEWTKVRRYVGLEKLAKAGLRLVNNPDDDTPEQGA